MHSAPLGHFSPLEHPASMHLPLTILYGGWHWHSILLHSVNFPNFSVSINNVNNNNNYHNTININQERYKTVYLRKARKDFHWSPVDIDTHSCQGDSCKLRWRRKRAFLSAPYIHWCLCIYRFRGRACNRADRCTRYCPRIRPWCTVLQQDKAH